MKTNLSLPFLVKINLKTSLNALEVMAESRLTNLFQILLT